MSYRGVDAEAGPIHIGISACILGEAVRYNGGHKLDRYLKDTLGNFVEFVPVCPEVELGLGVPRETLRLARVGDGVRLVAPRSGRDHTVAMQRYARRRTQQLRQVDLCGYVLQKGSPSCGMERVRVYDETGMPSRKGVGLFAATLMQTFPDLPVEEDGRLKDPRLRENFFERVFAYRRARLLFGRRWRRGELVDFHTREKLLLLAHDRPTYHRLGRLVADAKGRKPAELAEQYQQLFMAGLRRIATTRKHSNVLQHMAGYFKRCLDTADRKELQDVIEAYHQRLLPLVVPLTLIAHHARRHAVQYLLCQSYLAPHPRELMLRNHV